MINFEQSPLLSGIRGLGSQPAVYVQDELLEQLNIGIGQYYAHLPQKRSSLAIDPVEQIRLFRASGDGKSRSGFLRQLLQIINGLHDRHTTVSLPPPWRQLVAYVPFIVESCFVDGRAYYVVTKQLYGFDEIPVGAIVSHWNSVPIHLQVRRLAAESQGANRAAAMRLGLANLTVRPLQYVLMPEEDWVTLTYIDTTGQIKTASTPWRFYQLPGSSVAGLGNKTGLAMETGLGLDPALNIVNHFKRNSITSPSRQMNLQTDPLGIQYGDVKTLRGEAGYMRIFSFEVPDPLEFVKACEKILVGLPQDRLIIDVRGNPGGQILAGQKLIRMLTSKESISPSPVAFRNTSESRHLGNLSMFEPWQLSLSLQYATGQAFAQDLPLTTYDDVPAYRYPGKIALIIDALCYSTTDFFSADFKDNKIGIIVGVDPQTGGGGANVWTWDVLQSLAQQAGNSRLRALPGGFGFNIAIRRSVRTGEKMGIPVEDLGVEADVMYYPTLIDISGDNIQLIDFTMAQML